MLPTIYVGQLELSTYWIMFVLGVFTMLLIMWHRKAHFQLAGWQSIVFTLCLMVCGVAGTKTLYVIESIDKIVTGTFVSGGMSLFGAVFLIPLVMPLIGKLFRLSTGQSQDACAPCLAAMVATLRFGCFFAGCCGGVQARIGGYYFHWPTQAFDSVTNVFLIGFLLNKEARGNDKGRLYPQYMVGYSIMRFFNEFLRDTPKDWLLLSHGQWFALIAFMIGMVWLLVTKKAERKGQMIDS